VERAESLQTALGSTEFAPALGLGWRLENSGPLLQALKPKQNRRNAPQKIATVIRRRFKRLRRIVLRSAVRRLPCRLCRDSNPMHLDFATKKRCRHVRQRQGSLPTRLNSPSRLCLCPEARISKPPHFGQFIVESRPAVELTRLPGFLKHESFQAYVCTPDARCKATGRKEPGILACPA